MKSQTLFAIILTCLSLVLTVQGKSTQNSMFKVYRGGNTDSLSVIKTSEMESQSAKSQVAKPSPKPKHVAREEVSVMKNPHDTVSVIQLGGSTSEVELKCPPNSNHFEKSLGLGDKLSCQDRKTKVIRKYLEGYGDQLYNVGKLTNWKAHQVESESVQSCILAKVKKFLDDCTDVQQDKLVKVSGSGGRSLQVVKKTDTPTKVAKVEKVSPSTAMKACKKS